MAEEKKKKGFLSIVKESMTKSGGCCGSGETCTPSPPGPQEKKAAQKGREKDASRK